MTNNITLYDAYFFVNRILLLVMLYIDSEIDRMSEDYHSE